MELKHDKVKGIGENLASDPRKESEKKHKGATAIEYAIMLALVFAVCLAAVTFIGRRTSGTFSTVGSAMP